MTELSPVRCRSRRLFLLAPCVLACSLPTFGADADPDRMPERRKGKPPADFKELREEVTKQGFKMERPEFTPAEGVREMPDIVYYAPGGRKMMLDLTLPAKSEKPAPMVVLIHGGGWRKGDRKPERAKAIWLANRGYATAAIEYRLSGEARFPAALHDCKAAIRWVRSQAATYGYDPNRVAAVGFSAGAHLAALVASTADKPSMEPTFDDGSALNNVSSAVRAAVVVAGPTDTVSENAIAESRRPDSNYLLFLGGTYDEMPKKYEQISPARWVSAETPPVLMVGENSIEPHQLFLDKLAEANVPHESMVLTGGLHGEWNWEPWFSIFMRRTDRFLRQHLSELEKGSAKGRASD